MKQFNKDQRLLLKGIAELAARAWTLDEMRPLSIADSNSLARVKRALAALQHDARAVERQLPPLPAKAWIGLVKMAVECQNATQAAAFTRAIELRFDPPPLEADSQLTLPGME